MIAATIIVASGVADVSTPGILLIGFGHFFEFKIMCIPWIFFCIFFFELLNCMKFPSNKKHNTFILDRAV